MQTTAPTATAELPGLELHDVDALIAELEVQFQSTYQLPAHAPQDAVTAAGCNTGHPTGCSGGGTNIHCC